MADNKIFWSSQPILPIGNQATDRVQRDEKPSSDFADILARQQTKVKFSKHANERLRDRRIDLSDQQLAKLDDTVERMADLHERYGLPRQRQEPYRDYRHGWNERKGKHIHEHRQCGDTLIKPVLLGGLWALNEGDARSRHKLLRVSRKLAESSRFRGLSC